MTLRANPASRLLQRLQKSPGLGLLGLLLSACVFAFALYLAWLAFSNPLEIEIREGSMWLYVLAKRAGVDIYDTNRVAFVNMNHGPLDPILKGWISRCVPALPGHMVTRMFVLLCPVFLLASALVLCRRHLAAALLAAGALFLFLCHVSSMMFVGRSDASAVCALVVCGALAHRLLVTRHRGWSSRRTIATQVGLGAASAAAFLISWRYLPVGGALQAVVLTTRVGGGDHQRRTTAGSRPRILARVGVAAKHVLISTGLYLAGFAALWLAVFFFELHGDLRSYYRHFFGFFSAESGWGSFPGDSFHVVPNELVRTRLGSLLLLLALVLLGLYRLRKLRGQFVAWLLMLSAAWMAVSYGYFKNQGGGGLHYFFESLAFVWIFVLHAFGRGRRWGALTQLALVGLVAWTLPSRDLLAQREVLVDARTQARAFRREVARLTYGQTVFGEETHLFKLRYQGEVVDVGDSVAAIASSGYLGKDFTRTYEAYTRGLVSNPPKFVIGGLLPSSNPEGIMSATLQGLLRSRYTLRLQTHGTAFATWGSSQGLFERND